LWYWPWAIVFLLFFFSFLGEDQRWVKGVKDLILFLNFHKLTCFANLQELWINQSKVNFNNHCMRKEWAFSVFHSQDIIIYFDRLLILALCVFFSLHAYEISSFFRISDTMFNKILVLYWFSTFSCFGFVFLRSH
jgi:hypothetical protein